MIFYAEGFKVLETHFYDKILGYFIGTAKYIMRTERSAIYFAYCDKPCSIAKIRGDTTN